MWLTTMKTEGGSGSAKKHSCIYYTKHGNVDGGTRWNTGILKMVANQNGKNLLKRADFSL
jgi:hypothetical protein